MTQILNYYFWLQIIKKTRFLDMKNTKQLVVSMTGFVHDPQMQAYKQMLKQLDCKYVDQLSLEVDYLIVNHTCTQKYKIAELNNSRIQSITLSWLQDSIKSKKILNIDKYKINKIFFGVRVVVEGFENKKIQQKVIQLLKINGAQEVRQGLNNIKHDQLIQKYQLIIIPSVKVYKKLQLNLSQLLMIPLVTPQWLQQSIKSKKCKYPNDYALNYQNISIRSFDDTTNFRRLNKKVQYYMQADFLNPSGSALLCDQKSGQQLILYLDANSIEKNFANVLHKLICLTGGLYLNSYGPAVTHILVGAIEQSQYYKFMNYGDSNYIVRVQWLIDSILCAQRLPQIDFKVRGFKQPLIKSYNNMELKEKYQQNSQTLIHTMNKFTSNQFASMPIAPIKLTKSISVNRQEIKPAKIIPVIKQKAKSEIFRKKWFFIQKSQRKQSVISAIYNKIKENAGIIFNETSVMTLKNTKLFIVLRDSQKNSQYLQQTHKLIKNNGVQSIPISIRWIEQCIKKGQIIDHMQQNYFIFKPFSFQTPLRQLMTMKIQLLGIEQILKRRYKQLLIALGANKISPNIAEITHCLCGTTYQTDSRYQTIVHTLGQKQQKQKQTVSKQESNKKGSGLSNIKFVKIEWVLELMNNKGKTNIQEFLIVNDQPTQ